MGRRSPAAPLPRHRAYGPSHRWFGWLRQHSWNNDGRPSNLKYAFEKPDRLGFGLWEVPAAATILALLPASRHPQFQQRIVRR